MPYLQNSSLTSYDCNHANAPSAKNDCKKLWEYLLGPVSTKLTLLSVHFFYIEYDVEIFPAHWERV